MRINTNSLNKKTGAGLEPAFCDIDINVTLGRGTDIYMSFCELKKI